MFKRRDFYEALPLKLFVYYPNKISDLFNKQKTMWAQRTKNRIAFMFRSQL